MPQADNDFPPETTPAEVDSHLANLAGPRSITAESDYDRTTPFAPKQPEEPAPVPTKRYELLARAQVDGAVHGPGYRFSLPEGVRPPQRTEGRGAIVHDVPLAVEIDPAFEAEEEELRVRHAAEWAEFNRDAERAEITARQAEESAALRQRFTESTLALNQEIEQQELSDRQEAELVAFKAAEPAVVPAPVETNIDDLALRHKKEQDALDAKYAGPAPVPVPVQDQPSPVLPVGAHEVGS